MHYRRKVRGFGLGHCINMQGMIDTRVKKKQKTGRECNREENMHYRRKVRGFGLGHDIHR